MKVVTPARTSVPTLVSRGWSWDHRFRVSVMERGDCSAIGAAYALVKCRGGRLHTRSRGAHHGATCRHDDRGGSKSSWGRTLMAGQPVRLLAAFALLPCGLLGLYGALVPG